MADMICFLIVLKTRERDTNPNIPCSNSELKRNRWIHHQIRDVSISNLAAMSPVRREMAYAYLKRPFPFQATEHASAEWRVPVPNLCLTGKQRAGMESV